MSSGGGPSGTHPGDVPRIHHARAALEEPLERSHEIAELDAAISAARTGEGRVILLEGAGGLGKTSLLAVATRHAQAAGMTVLRARGGELERQFPFGVALQLFEPALSTAAPRERQRVLAGAAAHAEPLLSGRERPESSAGPPEFPLLHGLHWVAVNIAERQPLLLAIDDAHAADEASLRALLYTAQRVQDLSLAIVLTARPRPLGTIGADPLTALATHPFTRRLELATLSPRAIATIVRAQLPGADDAFCEACARATGGNPFFARELLAALTAAGIAPTAEQAQRVGDFGPATIAQAIEARLDRLSTGAGTLAHAVAILGEDAPLGDAAALARLASGEAALLVDELSAAEVLRAAPELGFAHPIVRQAVYQGIPPAERAQLHLEAAMLLRRGGPGGEDRAASHLLHTVPVGEPWVVACLHGVARRALAGGAPETAASYLQRALDESPTDAQQAALLIDLGRAEALAGRSTAIDRLRTAVALLDEPQERARALAQLGQALYAAGDNPGAASVFDEGLRILGGADPVLEEELTAGYLGAARLDFRTREAALTRFKDLLSGSTEATTPAQRELLAQRGLEHAMLGNAPAEEAIAFIRRAQGGSAMLRDITADGVAYAAAVAALLFCDALDAVEEAATAGLEDSRRRGSVVGFALMSALRGASRYLRGDLTRALGDLEGGLEHVPVMVLVRPFAYGWIALAHLDRGDFELAERLVSSPDEDQDQHFTYNWPLFARGRLKLMRGDAAGALEDLLECGRRQAAVPAPNPAVLPWRSEAAVAAYKLGRTEQALGLAQKELRLARTFRAPRALGTALRAAGLVTGGEEGLALLEQSVEVLDGSPSRLEHTRALVDLGAARRRAGQQTQARETLREALDACHRCGATELERFAHAELVAAGARPRRAAVRGAEALTPSELRVAELAERGLTNREIAQALFISTKTVEFHLRNAYLKLRIRSRRELTAALHAGRARGSGAPVDRDRGTARGGTVV